MAKGRLAMVGLVAALGVSFVVFDNASARASRSKPCGRVLWRSFRNGDQRCPRTHSLLADVYWTGLHWTTWGPRRATGFGQQVHRLAVCTGQPIHCRDSQNPIWVHLSNSIRCPGGERIYSRLDLTELSDAHRITARAHWSYKCRPSTPAQGGGAGGG